MPWKFRSLQSFVQRALASTIVGEQTEVIEPQAAYSESDILKDWFEHEDTEI